MAVHVGTLKDRCEKLQIAEQPTQDTRTCLQSVLFQTWNPYCSLNRFSPIKLACKFEPQAEAVASVWVEKFVPISEGASFHFPGRFFICAWTPGFVLRLQTSPSFSFIRKRSLVGSTRGASVAFKVVVGVIEWARAPSSSMNWPQNRLNKHVLQYHDLSLQAQWSWLSTFAAIG